MRTITGSMLNRLSAQAREAKVLGLNKVASNLEHEVSKYASNVRDNDALYSYARDDMSSDVEKSIWDAIIRVADFYGVSIDAQDGQNVVEKLAEDLIHNVSVVTGVTDGVGAYEPLVPGEHREHISIELQEDN